MFWLLKLVHNKKKVGFNRMLAYCLVQMHLFFHQIAIFCLSVKDLWDSRKSSTLKKDIIVCWYIKLQKIIIELSLNENLHNRSQSLYISIRLSDYIFLCKSIMEFHQPSGLFYYIFPFLENSINKLHYEVINKILLRNEDPR